MKKGFVLLILFLCIIINSFAMRREDIYDIALTNLYGYSNNICHLEEKDISNFQRLEENIRVLERLEQKDVINGLESDIWEANVPTGVKIRGTSLSNALRKYLKKYTGACSSCCMLKSIDECDGIELKKMYVRELKKYGLDF